MYIKIDMQKCLFISNYKLFNFPLEEKLEMKYNITLISSNINSIC